MEYELSIDPKVICRVCLAENTLKTVFCNEIVNGSILPFPKVFECVTGLKAVKDDGFPDKLCAPCRLTINDAYVLQQKCKNNQTLLCGVLNITVDEPVESHKPKICLAIGTQTDVEVKRKGANITTQTDWDTFNISTQTLAQDSKTIQTQTTCCSLKSIQSQTTGDTKCPTTTAECQTEVEWIPKNVNLFNPIENFKTISVISTTPEVPEDENDLKSVLLEVADILDADDDDVLPDNSSVPSEMMIEDEYDDVKAEEEEEEAGVEDEDQFSEEIEYLIDDDDDEHKIVLIESTDTISACKSCRKQFGSREEMEEHLKAGCLEVVNPRKRKRGSTVKRDHLICKLCKYQSKSSSDLDTHLQKHKRTLPMLLDSVYYFRCGRCNAVFMTVNDLNLHLDGIDSNPCVVSTTHEFCTDYQFLDDDDDDDEDRMDSGESLDDANNIDSLQRICSGIRIGDQMVLCNWCQEFQGSSAMEIWDHYVEAHFQLDASGETAEMSDSRATYCASFSDVHKCGYCDQTFRTLKDSIPHVFFHARSFGCPFPSCSDTYLRFHLLNYHMESKHLEVDKHQCEHCHLEMDSYAQKRRHMRYDCPERNYDCSKCNKKFYTQNDLLVHNKFHLNELRWQCNYCEKRFSQSGDLRTHERIHTGVKPYPCTICDKSFRSVGNRRDHMATHAESAPAKVECKVCNRIFKSERILRGHMAIHDEEKRFQCSVCSKGFYRNYHLKKHLQTHLA